VKDKISAKEAKKGKNMYEESISPHPRKRYNSKGGKGEG
jgi:hypothetical protein